MKILLVFIILNINNYLFSSIITDNITLRKIEKLIQKEEDIAKGYKKFLLKYGKVPSSIQNLIDIGFLPKGFDVKNPFGEEIEFIINKNEIKKFVNTNLSFDSTLNNYYFTNINRKYTKSPQKSIENITIKLNFIENFIYSNQNIITDIKEQAKSKTNEGGYYIENGVLNWFDQNGNYKFTIAEDIISKNQIINESTNNTLLISKDSKSNFYQLFHIGKRIYQPNEKGELNEFVNLGKKIVKLEKEIAPGIILIKNNQNGSGVIINGDIYTWGNNTNKVISIGKNYTKENNITGSGIPIINTVVRTRAKNYEQIKKDSFTKFDYNTVERCRKILNEQGNYVDICDEVETAINSFNSNNFYSSPNRAKFTNMYIDYNKSICAISNKNELYCGGEDILENNYIDFIGYEKGSKKDIDYLYKNKFFDGDSHYANDVIFIDNIYLALGRSKSDNTSVSKLYYWGKSNNNGYAGTGNKSETNIFTPTIVPGGYEFLKIFYDSTINKIIALEKNGTIYFWGITGNKEDCIQNINGNNINFCAPKILDWGKIDKEEISFPVVSIEQRINAIIALSTDDKYYKIKINNDGTASKRLVEDDIKAVSTLEEDKSILSFDYNENGIIWVNSNNKLKGTFTQIDSLFTKTINQISWEKIKVVSSNNGICGIDINKQMYCWGDLSNTNNDGFVVPIFGSNLQDENKDFIFLEKMGNNVTTVTSGDWLNNGKYFLKYPTFIGGFNYDVIFK